MAETTVIQAPPPIKKLDAAVVNKIAAGEVIQRPASALKELLENSLDAGATQISVTVKDGGIKLLQITDNGSGIRKADLPILCHRHTTSKLKEYEDLQTMSTLGFRGEALCSISFVSNMTVTTMTANAMHGWRVSYKDSEMMPPGPRPVAAVQGTTVSVEDLFYNVPNRRKAMKSATEEYSRIVDIVSRYAAYNAGVAFSCKRHGESRMDVSTLAAATRLDNIKAVYGSSVAKEMMPISIQVGKQPLTDLGVEDECSFTLEGFVSSANYQAKAITFILFINGRLVDCAPLKRVLEATYAAVLPKAARPFLLLDLRLPPRHVEVNLHPTKRDVGLLNQETVIEAIRAGVEKLLLSSNTTRTFTQQELPYMPVAAIQLPTQQPPVPADTDMLPDQDHEGITATQADLPAAGGSALRPAGSGGSSAVPYRPQKLVRVDSKTQSIDGFLSSQYATPRAAAVAGSVGRKRTAAGDMRPPAPDMTLDPLATDTLQAADTHQALQPASSSKAPLGVVTDLDSIRNLAGEVERNTHEGLVELLRNHTLVGMADDTLALVQHQTKLYLVNVATLSADLFYQQVLRNWTQCPMMELNPAPKIYDLMSMALDVEQAAGRWQEVTPGYKHQVCELAATLLIEKGPMLKEYLSMTIDEQGCLASLPILLPGHMPDLGYLPDLVMALGRDVDWEEEQACFKSLSQVLADFYSLKTPLIPALTQQYGASKRPSNHAMTPIDSQSVQPATATPGSYSEDVEMHISNGDATNLDSMTTEQQGVTAVVTTDLQGSEHGIDADTDMVIGDSLEDVVDNAIQDITEPTQLLATATATTPTRGDTGRQEPEALHKEEVASQDMQARAWMIKQVLFPALRSLLRPSKARANDGTFVLITSLEKLYRIFERC